MQRACRIAVFYANKGLGFLIVMQSGDSMAGRKKNKIVTVATK
jgi:hypothetical protein